MAILSNNYIHLFNSFSSKNNYETGTAYTEPYVGGYLYGDDVVGEVHYNKRYYYILTLNLDSSDIEVPMVLTDYRFLDENTFDFYVDGVKVLRNVSGSSGTHTEPLMWQFDSVGRHVISYFFNSSTVKRRVFYCQDNVEKSKKVVDVKVSPYISSIQYENLVYSNITSLEVPYNFSGVSSSIYDFCDINLDSIIVDERNTKYTSMDKYGVECNGLFARGSTNATSGSPVTLIRGCKNTVIPDTVTGISSYAFTYVRGLKSINIGANITSISAQSFYECCDLEYITVDGGNSKYSDGGGNIIIEKSSNKILASSKYSSIPSSVSGYISDNTVFYETVPYVGITVPSGCPLPSSARFSSADSISVEEGSPYKSGSGINMIFVSDNKTIRAACRGFEASGLTGDVVIGSYAFTNCQWLETADFSNCDVKEMYNASFYRCRNLTSVKFNDNNSSMTSNSFASGRTFNGCEKLESVLFKPNAVKNITNFGASAGNVLGQYGFFSGCTSLKDFKLEDFTGLTRIGKFVFADCKSLSSMTIPSKVDSIDEAIFKNCQSLTSLTVANGNTVFTDNGSNVIMKTSDGVIVAGCSTSVIPTGATSIMNYAFYGATGLTGVDLSNITSIGVCSFSVCKSLTSVVIPSGCTTIGDLAFAGCDNLSSITINNESSVVTLGYGAFNKVKSDFKIFVPENMLNDYKSANNWKYYSDKIYAMP